MDPIRNPAVEAFVSQIGPELVVAQVQIRRTARGYELRRRDDAGCRSDELRALELVDLRAIAQFTAEGVFRPLKSAPTLRSGWRFEASSDAALAAALDRLYPGAIADWYAALGADPPVTDFRVVAARQSGMYRITAKLADEQVAVVIGATCPPTQCLKRRWWSVSGLAPDPADEKSLIPCLEPCAILMEAARQAVRREQRNEAAS